MENNSWYLIDFLYGINEWKPVHPSSPVLTFTIHHTVFPCPSLVWRETMSQSSNHFRTQCLAGGPSRVGFWWILNKPVSLTRLLSICLIIFILYRRGLWEQISSTALGFTSQKQSPWIEFKHSWFIWKVIPGNTNRRVEKWDMKVKKCDITSFKKQVGNQGLVPLGTTGRL